MVEAYITAIDQLMLQPSQQIVCFQPCLLVEEKDAGGAWIFGLLGKPLCGDFEAIDRVCSVKTPLSWAVEFCLTSATPDCLLNAVFEHIWTDIRTQFFQPELSTGSDNKSNRQRDVAPLVFGVGNDFDARYKGVDIHKAQGYTNLSCAVYQNLDSLRSLGNRESWDAFLEDARFVPRDLGQSVTKNSHMVNPKRCDAGNSGLLDDVG